MNRSERAARVAVMIGSERTSGRTSGTGSCVRETSTKERRGTSRSSQTRLRRKRGCATSKGVLVLIALAVLPGVAAAADRTNMAVPAVAGMGRTDAFVPADAGLSVSLGPRRS